MKRRKFPCDCSVHGLVNDPEIHSQATMMQRKDDTFDEDAATEAARQQSAVSHPHDLLKREHDRILGGHPRDVALEKWGPEIEERIHRDLELRKRKGRK
jgi:hypothetical protein